jgi:tetraacyldisaccharide 4'-kinase
VLKSFRYLFLPISILYGGIILLRNALYNKKIFTSATFNFPIICVGNLAVGGTGKTPMVELLLRMLQQHYKVATISRGYKRKTKGFGIANNNTTALEIGDEPMQFHQKFANVTVAVGEERLVAIPQLLQEKPATEVIILDDAFQHRSVQAGLNILLTEYKNLYCHDFMMPAGDLRDVKASAARAEVIIVTKCKNDIGIEEKNKIVKQLKPQVHQTILFASLNYDMPSHLFNNNTAQLNNTVDVLLVCGIANPKPLKDYLTSTVRSFDMLRYPDHHIFDSDDLTEIKKHFQKLKSENKLIITTEKDGVRLQKFENELANFPLYVLPIQHQFLFEGYTTLEDKVINFINLFKK